MRIVFLLSVVSDARYRKRITALERLGVQPRILAFERDYYTGKPWSQGYTSLGQIQHRHYYERFLPLLRAFPVVCSAVRGVDAVYTFGLDTLWLAWLAKRVLGEHYKIIYEVGDIFEVQVGRSVSSHLLRLLERFLLRRVDLFLVTSKSFIDGYYHRMQGLKELRYQVIENKLDADVLPNLDSLPTPKADDGILRIGYFGLLRCKQSWNILRKIAVQGRGRVQVYLRGVPIDLDDFEQSVRNCPYLNYDGPYISPDDLAEMYQQVQMSWVATHIFKTHFQWARTNRFYEACYFRKPMLAQIGTQDGQVVESLGLGTCIDLENDRETLNRILTVSPDELSEWQANMVRLPTSLYIYTNEHEKLIDSIRLNHDGDCGLPHQNNH